MAIRTGSWWIRTLLSTIDVLELLSILIRYDLTNGTELYYELHYSIILK